MNPVVSIIVMFNFLIFNNAANILVLLPYPFYSHSVTFLPIFTKLAERGHNVTIFTAFPQRKSITNLTEIEVPNIMDKVEGPSQHLSSLKFQFFDILKFGFSLASAALITDPIKRLIKDEVSTFDLVITETWCLQEPFVAFGHKFNAPVINLLSLFIFPRNAYITGNHFPVSYVPIVMYFNFNDHMTFFERIQNSLFYYWDIVVANLYYLRRQDAIMRKYFKYPNSDKLPPLKEMLRNTSLTLMEHHFSVGYPAPLHNNIVPFIGVSLNKEEKLSQDLQNFMDNGKEGVIYFSMGTLFNTSEMRPDSFQAIVTVMQKIKYRVLMKLDDPTSFGKFTNPNIKIRKWLPQRSILAHPNCKLFITHGGLHGTLEGVYHAVPMIGIPLFGDQHRNVKFMETAGIGFGLEIEKLTVEKLLNSIAFVLNNPSYKENIKKRSAMLKDTPMDTLDNVIYWIEYVMRHKGAPHLRPAALDLYWFQYLMLDVLAFNILTIAFSIYFIKSMLCLMFKWLVWLFWENTVSKTCYKKPKKE